MTAAVNIFVLALSVHFYIFFAALQKLHFVDFFCCLSVFLNSGLDTVPCRIFEIRLVIVIISLIS